MWPVLSHNAAGWSRRRSNTVLVGKADRESGVKTAWIVFRSLGFSALTVRAWHRVKEQCMYEKPSLTPNSPIEALSCIYWVYSKGKSIRVGRKKMVNASLMDKLTRIEWVSAIQLPSTTHEWMTVSSMSLRSVFWLPHETCRPSNLMMTAEHYHKVSLTNMNFLLAIISTLSKEKVMRFNKIITSGKMLWSFIKFS